MIFFRLKELIGKWEMEHRKRLSFDDLGKALGISPQVLSKMADPTANYATSTRHVDVLCQYFGVEASALIAIFPDEPPRTPE